MPCLNLSTNASLDGVDTSSILSELSKTVASLIGKPEAVRFVPPPLSLSISPFSVYCLYYLPYQPRLRNLLQYSSNL